MALTSSDVVVQSSVSRLDDCTSRLGAVEEECKQKVRADYWQPQIEALVRADKRIEERLGLFEKEVTNRLQQESLQRDDLKHYLQDALKTCAVKDESAGPASLKNSRFIE